MRRGLRFLFCMLLLLSALALPPVLAEEEEDTDRLYQEQLEASGAEALFVMADGEIVMSEGMEQCFTEQ